MGGGRPSVSDTSPTETSVWATLDAFNDFTGPPKAYHNFAGPWGKRVGAGVCRKAKNHSYLFPALAKVG